MYSRISWEATSGLVPIGATAWPRAVDPAEPRFIGEHDPQATTGAWRQPAGPFLTALGKTVFLKEF